MISASHINISSNGLNKLDEASAAPSTPTAPSTLVRTLSETSSFVTLTPEPAGIATDHLVGGVDTETIPRTISTTETTKLITILEAAGGSDKDATSGYRRDTVPIIEAINQKGVDSEVLQFQEENAIATANESQEEVTLRNEEARAHNDAIRSALMTSQGIIVRNNPGTLSTASQSKFDSLLLELDKCGAKVMSHPEVVKRMGAKDALCKIRHMRCGLEDTDVYYEPDAFYQGFRKSIAFRPRVIKQNRGSQGEGIWIIKLKDESAYCETFGDRIADLDTMITLVEANDNHVEEHTVAEFLEFCVNGRSESSGEWLSTGDGKYLEGGMEAGAMLVDQRFLPRIVEGEVRCLMIGPNLVELIHKKPKAGGVSATLQSGATYTTYAPDAPEFATLVENFQSDLPSIMKSFDMEDQPLPLIWTADYIFGEKDANGRDTFYVGEFNCSCVGITKQLQLAHVVAETAVNTCFQQKEEQVEEKETENAVQWLLPMAVAAAATLAVVVLVQSTRRMR